MAHSVGDKVQLEYPGITYDATIIRPGENSGDWYIDIDGQELLFPESRFEK